MIDYELSPDIAATRDQLHMLAEHAMRPIARDYDEREHEKPWDFINMMWQLSKNSGIGPGREKDKKEKSADAERNLRTCVAVEELSWGDAGLYLAMPGPGLGGAAVMAAGTPQPKTSIVPPLFTVTGPAPNTAIPLFAFTVPPLMMVPPV